MQLFDIHPFVRYARRMLPIFGAAFSKPLVAYDHRLFCCVGGEDRIYVCGEAYPLTAGRVLYVRAGVPYQHTVMGKGAELFAFNFDFGMASAAHAQPIPPATVEQFRPEGLLEAEVPSHPAFASVCAVSLPDMMDTAVRMEREYRHGRLLYEECVSHLLADLLLNLVRAAVHEETPRTALTAQSVTAYIREHYAEPLDNARIAEVFCYHPNYVNRLMVEHTGRSLHAYLTRYRIDRAMSLLSSTSLSVAEIAARVGIPDLSHFSKCFRRYTGYAPGAFRCKP